MNHHEQHHQHHDKEREEKKKEEKEFERKEEKNTMPIHPAWLMGIVVALILVAVAIWTLVPW